MNKNAALTSLGLTGTEDASGVTQAYGKQLTAAQEKLVTAKTDAERQQCQARLSELVEAYEFLTETGRYTRASNDDPSVTVLRSAGAPAAAAVHDTLVRMETGALLSGRLEVGALLGSGGMGYVYAARDRLKNEDVAIKVLRQDLLFSTAAKERFLAEAKVSCNLSHPNIIRVYDVGCSGDYYYFSMERLKGHTLRQRIEAYAAQNREFPVQEVTDIARQLVDALRYAHRYIVHRDLKPENIWLAEDGTVKLMDFGIARAYSSSQLTQTGMTLGTAYYMAPEQRIAAKEVDWRADQYALGVVLYELLTGTVPMGAVAPLEEVRRDLPLRYARALMRAISPKPEGRWPSLNELWAEIEAPPRKSLSAAAVVLIGIGAAATAAAGIYFIRGSGSEQATAAMTQDESVDTVVDDPPATDESGGSGEPPSEPPSDALPEAQSAPPVNPESGPAADDRPPERLLPPRPPPPRPGDPPPRLLPASSAPVQVAVADTARNFAHQECIAQCERDHGECRSINRRGRQECMRAVGFGGAGGLNQSATSNDAAAQCAYFTDERCEHAPHPAACLSRMNARYNQCITAMNGTVVSRRQDCEERSRESERLCFDELRDCRGSCE